MKENMRIQSKFQAKDHQNFSINIIILEERKVKVAQYPVALKIIY